jgi:hypothetical protein
MICSYLKNDNIGFIELHPEQVYTFLTEAALNSCDASFNERKSDDLDSFTPAYLTPPIFANTLTVSTLLKVIDFVKETSNMPPNFILDFDKFIYIQKNLKKEFIELQEYLRSKGSNLFFINFNIDIEKETDINYLKNFNILNGEIKLEIGENEVQSVSELNDIKEAIFNDKKHVRFVASFTKYDPPYLHESSSVYLKQYFDFKLLVSGEKVDDKLVQFKDSTFIYYCIYKIALKMISKNEFHDWKISPNQKVIIFCQTLNSSYIGSFLADLVGTDIFLVDHLGPKAKLYSKKLYQSIDENQSYLVVSDVLCLGSEVKNSKAIIEFSGAEYLGNVAFLRVESRKDADIDFNDIEFFYRITQEYNPVDYSILTALNNFNG